MSLLSWFQFYPENWIGPIIKTQIFEDDFIDLYKTKTVMSQEKRYEFFFIHLVSMNFMETILTRQWKMLFSWLPNWYNQSWVEPEWSHRISPFSPRFICSFKNEISCMIWKLNGRIRAADLDTSRSVHVLVLRSFFRFHSTRCDSFCSLRKNSTHHYDCIELVCHCIQLSLRLLRLWQKCVCRQTIPLVILIALAENRAFWLG